jgi:uncharacterized membrane protein affecting hemolysin expression
MGLTLILFQKYSNMDTTVALLQVCVLLLVIRFGIPSILYELQPLQVNQVENLYIGKQINFVLSYVLMSICFNILDYWTIGSVKSNT